MIIDPDNFRLFSHHVMAIGFAGALIAMLSVRRFGYVTLYFLALIESYAGLRYPFHILIRDALLNSQSAAAEKLGLQIRMLTAIGIFGAVLLLILFPFLQRAKPGERLIVIGTLLVVLMFGLELVSLHSIDRIIYQPVGPVALCSLAYFAAATLAACGAFLEHRRQRIAAIGTA